MYHSLIVVIFNFRKIFKFDHSNIKNEKGKYSRCILTLVWFIFRWWELKIMKKKGEFFSKCWCKREKKNEKYYNCPSSFFLSVSARGRKKMKNIIISLPPWLSTRTLYIRMSGENFTWKTGSGSGNSYIF